MASPVGQAYNSRDNGVIGIGSRLHLAVSSAPLGAIVCTANGTTVPPSGGCPPQPVDNSCPFRLIRGHLDGDPIESLVIQAVECLIKSGGVVGGVGWHLNAARCVGALCAPQICTAA